MIAADKQLRVAVLTTPAGLTTVQELARQLDVVG